jgi:hypothetical protein
MRLPSPKNDSQLLMHLEGSNQQSKMDYSIASPDSGLPPIAPPPSSEIASFLQIQIPTEEVKTNESKEEGAQQNMEEKGVFFSRKP